MFVVLSLSDFINQWNKAPLFLCWRNRSKDRDYRRDGRDHKRERSREKGERRSRSSRDEKPKYRSRSRSPHDTQSKEDRRLGRRASSPISRKR